jgi:RNA recognition motif-containing protein
LAAHFKKAPGFVSAEVLTSTNGRSRGYGLVEFSSSTTASKAIEAFNESTLGERKIFVRLDRGNNVRSETEEKRPARNNGNRGNFNRSNIAPLRVRPEDEGRLLYVGNIPWRSSWQDIKDFFREVGAVIRVDIPVDKNTRRSRGFATVLFEKQEDAKAAIEKLNNTEMGGRSITVRFDQYIGGKKE